MAGSLNAPGFRHVGPVWCWRCGARRAIAPAMTRPPENEARRRMLLFRAQRRGFRELDLIFGAFADAHLASLGDDELDIFEALLAVPDWRIYAWIVGREPVPPEYDTDVFARLRAYRNNLGA